MPAPAAPGEAWLEAARVADVPPGTARAVALRGHTVALFNEGGILRATDNRCPHMGFPLHKGALQDGILTCAWHQWQFDAASGGCLSPGSRGTDLRTYRAEVRAGSVWVEIPAATGRGERERLERSLARAVLDASTLRAAKTICALLRDGAPPSGIARTAALTAVRLRREFGAGLLWLPATLNVLEAVPLLDETRTLALVHAVRTLSQEIAGTPARRYEIPLPTAEEPAGREETWFRSFLDDREVAGAERILLHALARGDPPARVAPLLSAAATDHVFIGLGHSLDAVNKAFELLEAIGWEHAPAILPPLLPLIAEGTRHEEDMTWKRPDDLVALAAGHGARIPAADAPPGRWTGEPLLVDALLGDDPAASMGALEAARALALAASIRLARFHPQNEFSDWDTAHHAMTNAHALYRAMRRSPSPALARGLFHAAAYLFLARKLNVPRVRLPHETGTDAPPGAAPGRDLAACLQGEHGEEAARLVHAAWSAGGTGVDAVLATLSATAFEEDLGFHTVQQLDAAIRLFKDLSGHPLQYIPLAGLARWLAAHAPTRRTVRQTVRNAIRLERGEALYEA